MVMGLKNRNDIKTEFKWRVSDVFETDAVWESEFKHVKLEIPLLSNHSGTLNQSSDCLLTFIKNMHSVEESLGRIYLYAHLKNDEDKAESLY